MKTYAVTLGSPGEPTRQVRVPSPTDVQAGDAARPLMTEGESIFRIEELEDDDGSGLDAEPPVSQAQELASVTPGQAAVSDGAERGSDGHG